MQMQLVLVGSVGVQKEPIDLPAVPPIGSFIVACNGDQKTAMCVQQVLFNVTQSPLQEEGKLFSGIELVCVAAKPASRIASPAFALPR